MAAKLDTSKPLRLIGIQLFDGTHANVRKILSSGWYPFIKCDNDDIMGTNKNLYPVVSEDCCPQDYYWIDRKRMPRISISAIAGKNGSGKSSLIEILYRILNNFAEELLQTDENKSTKEIKHAYGLEARLFFELDGVQKYINTDDGGVTYFEMVNGKPKKINIHHLPEKHRNKVLNGFFYTICVNYSLYAFNPADYYSPFNNRNKYKDNGQWLDNLFHKNDGYYIPIVLTPYREDGQIDVNNENELAKQRIEVLSLLFHSQEKEFLDDYEPSHLSFKYINDFWEKKKESLFERPIMDELKNSQFILISSLERIWEKALMTKFHRNFQPEDSDRDKNVLFYLAYKTVKICSTYPKYRNMSRFDDLLAMKEQVISEETGRLLINEDGIAVTRVSQNSADMWCKQNYNELFHVVTKIMSYHECNHITLKIHQCLDYLKENRYIADEGRLDVDKELLKGKPYETYDDMMRLLPPPFFITEVSYRRKKRNSIEKRKYEMTLQSMSSGERQMLYSLSYVYYHIKNIASIKKNGKRVVGYHHINLIFDEAELYYHPEYQRQYITRLLEKLAMCNVNRTNIRSINIIIITHSPFILSDLPKSNILFLHKGDDDAEEVGKETLGANIYDLLKSSFFLEYAIGDLVQKKLQDILKIYYEEDPKKQREMFQKNKEEYRYTINHLGEDYLRHSFQDMYDQMEYMMFNHQDRELIQEEFDYHKKWVEILAKRLEKDEKDEIS